MMESAAWHQAERDVIGAMLQSKPLREYALDRLDPADFHDTHCRDTYIAIEQLHALGQIIDRNVVAASASVPLPWILQTIAGTPSSSNVEAWCEIVSAGAYCRRAIGYAQSISESARAWDAGLTAAVVESGIPAPPRNELDAAEDAQVLAGVEFEYDWLIPGLLERRERVMVVGGEGSGKSLLLRQFAVAAASGLHPFDFSRVRRVKTLIVDLENSRLQVARSLKRLVGCAGDDYVPGWCLVRTRQQGMDLTAHRDVRWLDQVLATDRPDLVVFGSLYKAYRGADGRGKGSEEAAELVAHAIDELRVRHDCAWLIEAHAPHGDGGDRAGWRPSGSSLWLRWPEIGLGLSKAGEDGRVRVVHWRGFRDRERVGAWPRLLCQGRGWPWVNGD